MYRKPTFVLLSAALLLSGCATSSNNQSVADANTEMQTQVQEHADQTMTGTEQVTDSKPVQAAYAGTSNDLLPPNAKAGECYARILVPATYRTENQDVLKKEASYRIAVTKPEYEWTTEQVMVKESSEIAELTPAKYDWKVEKVLTSEAYDELKTFPATYSTKTEKILVKSSYTSWKKGRGPIEKVDNSTGEIMCLVEVPAEYKSVTSKVMVSPARTEKVTHPAMYKELKKRIMVESPKMVKTTIPAEYKTIKVKKIAKTAQETRIDIPAEYQTVTNRIKVSDSYLQWRSILCETNINQNIVMDLQRALFNAGHNPGPIDGVIGRETMSAMTDYQKEKNLAFGQLTIETLKSLGVAYN